jgi:hypothetical protein
LLTQAKCKGGMGKKSMDKIWTKILSQKINKLKTIIVCYTYKPVKFFKNTLKSP